MQDPQTPEKTLIELEWPILCDALAKRTATQRGESAARDLPLLDTPDSARNQLSEIGEARGLIEREESPPLGDIRQVDKALSTLEREAILDPADIVSVATTAMSTARLARHLEHWSDEAPRLGQLAADMPDLTHIAKPIVAAFDESQRLRDEASPELAELRRETRRLDSRLSKRMKELLHEPNLEQHMQEDFITQREGRYVLPIKIESRSRVPGIVHGTSQTGQTVFLEPEEVIELNNKLKMAANEAEREERRILFSFCANLGEKAADLRKAVAGATRVDFLLAAAKLANDLEAAPPTIIQGGNLDLPQARHPLLTLAGGCVASDLELLDGQVLILSGPNAGGKTVALKTIGLAALMTRAGLHIPAGNSARVPWYGSVWSDISDDQSLSKSLSSFSAHMLYLRDALSQANTETLLLIDEVAVGTDPEQGAALAQAAVEDLATRKIPTVITTHYERLKLLASKDRRFCNASVGFDFERLEPTFRVQFGVPAASGALLVARRMELPKRVVDRAEEILGSGRSEIDRLIEDIDQQRQAVAGEKEAVALERSQTEAKLRGIAKLERQLKQGLADLRRKAQDEVLDLLRTARLEIEELRKSARKAKRVGELPVIKSKLAEVAKKVESLPITPEKDEEASAEPASLRPGKAVRIRGWTGVGKVVDPPRRGKVTIQTGGIRTTARVEDVILAKEKPKVPDSPRHSLPASERYSSTELDVRGKRADEATAELERFLNDAYVAHLDLVTILHGHGTGSLKKAVRKYLDSHPLVAKWRPVDSDRGGDGKTEAHLDL